MFDQITNPKMCESKQIFKVILVRCITGSDIQSYDGLFMCTAKEGSIKIQNQDHTVIQTNVPLETSSHETRRPNHTSLQQSAQKHKH